MAQRVLKQPVSTKDELLEHSPEDLDALFQELQAELAKLNSTGENHVNVDH